MKVGELIGGCSGSGGLDEIDESGFCGSEIEWLVEKPMVHGQRQSVDP